MKLVPYVAVGIFWIGAYVAGGWLAVGIMAAVGFVGELALFGAGEFQARRDRRVAERRLQGLR